MGEPILGKLMAKDFSEQPLCMTREALNDGDNPLIPDLIQYLPKFEGLEAENPHIFLTEFYTTCNSLKFYTTRKKGLRS